MADKKPSSRLWDFLVILAVVYLAVEFGMRWFFPSQPDTTQSAPVVLQMQDATVSVGTAPLVTVRNNTDLPLALVTDNCLPFAVYRVEGTDKTLLEGEPEGECTPPASVPAGKAEKITLAPWTFSLFGEQGTYELQLLQGTGSAVTGTGAVATLTVGDPGIVAKIFRAFITKPLLNALIFIASIVPQHDLGVSIILLTLIVKLILFIPTQHALEGQKKMQLLQPKFEAVRREFKDNPTKMNEETMKIWKEHKINPLQSCLPLLVQFPVLIGLFYVIRNGANLGLSRHLLYPVYQNLSWTFDQHFLGLDLTKPYVWIFPPLLVILQFLQIKLSLVIADKKKAKEIAAKTTPAADTPQEVQQKVMLYILPLVIGFFSLSYASALSIYWGISTLFAIGQQLLVNREHLNVRG
jgi:YidC/Oxa1 family membrane protein insertase